MLRAVAARRTAWPACAPNIRRRLKPRTKGDWPIRLERQTLRGRRSPEPTHRLVQTIKC